jgi:hypothetical protein
MKKTFWKLSVIFITAQIIGCSSEAPNDTFQRDVDFLLKYTSIITLKKGDGLLAVSPSLQGRVMTSSADGPWGSSFGWINKSLFQSGDTLPQINPFGGEERFWLGPEGGQFGLFFKKDDPFDFDHWQTPVLIDTEPFTVLSQSDTNVVFIKEATLTNYTGFEFKIAIKREVRILQADKGVKNVAYQSINTITNIGDKAWGKETGLLSIWLLGMFKPTDETVVMIPFNRGNESKLGKVVTDDYFGKIEKERLYIDKNTNMIYFMGDGKSRTKIGLSAERAKNVLGSYDAINQWLTVVEYSKPDGQADYVNSKWETQKKPYSGDVINSYNDGPTKSGGKPLGPFYELETSSPAAALKPGQSITHTQTTRHYQGDERVLSDISKRWFGVPVTDKDHFFDYFFHYGNH